MKILLLAPALKTVHSWDLPSVPLVRKKAFMVPLPIATLAGLTPGHILVDLWDEGRQGEFRPESSTTAYDLVGISCYSINLDRARELAGLFHEFGIPVAAGGPGISETRGERLRAFDILFRGEAELTWPRFLADFETKKYKREYKEKGFPALVHSPVPKWDSISHLIKDYVMGAVQPVRGCINHCNFCNIPLLFGRKMRLKSIDKILKEVTNLEKLGIEQILFCSDNFIGDPVYAKELLRQLRRLNNSFTTPLGFHAELTIDAAGDDEMLCLLADANFVNLFIGIETPNLASLKASGKTRNLKGDLLSDCQKILSYGLPVEGSLVLGFDQDTPHIFEQHFEFLQQSCIPYTRLYLLRVKENTPLWHSINLQGRLLNTEKIFADDRISLRSHYRCAANMIPGGMTRKDLFSGYVKLCEKIYDWQNFASRIKGFISLINRKPRTPPGPRLPAEPPRALREFISSLDTTAAEVAADLLTCTTQMAPFMLKKVVVLIVRQYLEAANLPRLKEAVARQIRFEESPPGEMVLPAKGALYE